jgi:hypothetical protein
MAEDKLTDKQKLFLDYVFSKFPLKLTEKTYEEAKAHAGYSESTPLVYILRSLKDEIIERTKEVIALYGPEAFGEQLKLLRKPNDKWWKAKLSISDSILNRIGVNNKDEDQAHVMPLGIIILPPKDVPCGNTET